MRMSSFHAANRRESGRSGSHSYESARFRFLIFTTTLFALPLLLPAIPIVAQSNNEYTNLVAQANADLDAGNTAKALEEAQQAEKLDSKRWEAYVVAEAAAQQLEKKYDAAVDSFTDALANAPEDKRTAIKDLLEKSMQEEAAGVSTTQPTVPSGSANSAPAPEANNSGPTLAETMKFIQDKLNENYEGRESITADPTSLHRSAGIY